MEGVKAFGQMCIEHSTNPLPRQRNEDCIELRLITKGIQIYRVDQTELSFSGGDLLVIPPRARYSTGNHPQYKHTYFQLKIASGEEHPLLGLSPSTARSIRAYLLSLNAYRYHGNALLAEILTDALRFCTASQPRLRLRGQGELIRFLFSLEDLIESASPQRAPNIDIAFRYINDHITEEICLQDLAALSKCSLSHFKRTFVLQSGVTPMYYINWRKIAYAKRMIAQDYSITEVATALGYASPAYFATVFKKITSRTPSMYKSLIDIELRKQRHVSEDLYESGAQGE